eukprot:gene25524-55408_t
MSLHAAALTSAWWAAARLRITRRTDAFVDRDGNRGTAFFAQPVRTLLSSRLFLVAFTAYGAWVGGVEGVAEAAVMAPRLRPPGQGGAADAAAPCPESWPARSWDSCEDFASVAPGLARCAGCAWWWLLRAEHALPRAYPAPDPLCTTGGCAG